MTNTHEAQSEQSPRVVVERTFDAPVELIWQLWTDPRHFKAWYGPLGASVPVANHDVRVGGKRLVCLEMQTPNGEMQMWFTGEFTEVVPNRRLVYTDSLSDSEGNVVSAAAMGMPDGHPDSTEVIVELEDLGGRTKMVMTHVGVPEGSGGAGGWAMAFEKLEGYLATIAG
jgi:uncharacterized protein YndB with AHSA1/START domain